MDVADIIARDSAGVPILIAEAKNKRGTSTAWATQVHRNIRSHSTFWAPFFLLATPDRFYLWNEAPSPESPPSAAIDPSQLLQPYIQATGLPDTELGASGFELIVTTWLRELALQRGDSTEIPPQLHALAKELRGAQLQQHALQ